jgi:hypothetical protein
MSDAPEPHNDFERDLLAAQQGRMTSDDLLRVLVDTRVFMPVADEKTAVANVQRSVRAQPLLMIGENDTPVLVLFSSPERAKPFLADRPGYSGGLLVEFRWVLERMGDGGYGIVFNPGEEIGFDMEPATVAQLVHQLHDDNKELQ